MNSRTERCIVALAILAAASLMGYAMLALYALAFGAVA